jgi:hypothetical protein
MDKCAQNGTKYHTVHSAISKKAAEVGLGNSPCAAAWLTGGKAAVLDPPAYSLWIDIEIVGDPPN